MTHERPGFYANTNKQARQKYLWNSKIEKEYGDDLENVQKIENTNETLQFAVEYRSRQSAFRGKQNNDCRTEYIKKP